MRTRLLLIVLLLGLHPVAGWSTNILEVRPDSQEIVISHEPDRNWNLLDRVCFFRESIEVACGEVTFTNPKNAVVTIRKIREGLTKRESKESKTESYVELEFGRDKVKNNDRVERFVTPSQDDDSEAQSIVEGLVQLRRAASEGRDKLEGKEDLKIENKPATEDLDERYMGHGCMSNISLGLNYIFPAVQYQQAVTNTVTIGVLPMYLSTPTGNGALTGLGTYLTMNRYSIEPFHGDWMMLGLGFFKLTGTANGVSTDYTSPALILNVGWRWFWDSGINFGFALGFQYMISPKPPSGSLDFSGLLPSIALDIGYAF